MTEALRGIRRGYGDLEMLQAIRRYTLATARTGHLRDGEGAELFGARQKVGILHRERRLRAQHDVFSRTPADLAFAEEICEAGLAVLQAGRAASDERVAVHEAHIGAELAVVHFQRTGAEG